MSSVPRNSEMARSSSLCGSCVPQMNRTDAMPLPQRSSASWAACFFAARSAIHYY